MNDVPGQTNTPLASLIIRLRDLIGDRASTVPSLLQQHGRGESWHPTQAPDVVCFARNNTEVAQIVCLCAEVKIPIIAFGAGTSLEGHVQAVKGGVCINLSEMNAVLVVNSDDLDCRVQAGVTRKQLNAYLRDTGLFFPIDPGADASIGGMVATRASGTNAVRYGTMRENVLALTMVTARGDIIRTGSRARKSSAGYDLTRLMIGSEGTLGIITEITLRLYGLSEAISSAIVNFPNVRSAVDTTIETIQMGIPIARIELLDRAYMKAINRYSQTSYAERDTLFVEFHGTSQAVAEQVRLFDEISQQHGANGFERAQKESDRNRLWRARHNAYYAGLAMRPGSRGYVTDVCVPISQLADCIDQTQQDLETSGLYSPILGHVGDGNFHLTIFIDPDDQAMYEQALQVDHRLVKRALAMGGTCTGEHGIGLGKLKHMRAEHGDGAVNMMRSIKQALDPDNIMNPGKTVDC